MKICFRFRDDIDYFKIIVTDRDSTYAHFYDLLNIIVKSSPSNATFKIIKDSDSKVIIWKFINTGLSDVFKKIYGEGDYKIKSDIWEQKLKEVEEFYKNIYLQSTIVYNNCYDFFNC